MGRALVIGLDGASWDLLNPWIEEGRLPTMEKLIKEGVHGTLKSTNPPVTGPAWVSFATGKHPGKHGCYGFFLPKRSLTDTPSITTRDIKGDTFYELLDRQDKKCILINLPCSYPPRIQETLITDFLTKGNNFFFPPDLVTEIPKLKDYRVVPGPNRKGESFILNVSDQERTRFECAQQLFQKDWDFFFLLFDVPDSILHRIDEKIIPGKKVAALKVLTEIDDYIGWFVAQAPDADIFIMSDHGFRGYDRAFAQNAWLANEGYAKIGVASIKAKKEDSSFLERSKASSWTQRLLRQLLRKGIPLSNPLVRNLASLLYPIIRKVTRPQGVIHFTADPESLAYSMTYHGNYASIYLNSRERFEKGIVANREQLRAEIMAKLENAVDKAGKKIFASISKGEEVYFGGCTDKAPDIVLVASDDCSLTGINYGKVNNAHALEGIFIASGANTKKDNRVDVEIVDLAPTILHSMGFPVPGDMDGQVLKGIFREDSEPASRPVRYQEAGEESRIRGKISELKKSRNV
ncbi:alkaline phosphatase family protein [Chloroflexota bacterium]